MKPENSGFVFDGCFIEAFLSVPGGHRVMGKKLFPFSLWHKTQLEFHNSPFLLGKTVNAPDIELAVAVCRTQFPNAAQYCAPVGWRRHLWMLRAMRMDIGEAVRAFENYLSDYYSPPKIERVQKVGQQFEGRREPDMDEALGEVTFYRKMTGCPREEPWNIPIGELYWMNAGFRRIEGAEFLIITPMEEARKARLRTRRQAKLDARATELIAEGISEEEAKAQALQEHRESLRIRVRNPAQGGVSV